MWLLEPMLLSDPPVFGEIERLLSRLKNPKRVQRAVVKKLRVLCDTVSVKCMPVNKWVRWYMQKNGGGIVEEAEKRGNRVAEQQSNSRVYDTLTLHVPARIREELDRLVRVGLFPSVSEAVRTAVVMMLRDLYLKNDDLIKALIAEMVSLRKELEEFKVRRRR